MRIALYAEEGRQQLVLTPESSTEKTLVGLLGHDTQTLKVQAYRGGFYACQGGWTREGAERDSLIIVMEPAA